MNEDIIEKLHSLYQEFAKICVDNDLSNNVTDSFIQFFNKNANIKESPLPKNSKEMHKFMNTLVAPNLDFKKKHIINFSSSSSIDKIHQKSSFFLSFISI